VFRNISIFRIGEQYFVVNPFAQGAPRHVNVLKRHRRGIAVGQDVIKPSGECLESADWEQYDFLVANESCCPTWKGEDMCKDANRGVIGRGSVWGGCAFRQWGVTVCLPPNLNLTRADRAP